MSCRLWAGSAATAALALSVVARLPYGRVYGITLPKSPFGKPINPMLFGRGVTGRHICFRHADKAARGLCPTRYGVTAVQAILKNLGWRFCSMAKLVFGMSQSLDGYVDHLEMQPDPALFRHFYEHERDVVAACTVAARTRSCAIGMKTIPSGVRMTANSRRCGGANRHGSCRAPEVGPNAALVDDDLEAVIRGLAEGSSSLGDWSCRPRPSKKPNRPWSY